MGNISIMEMIARMTRALAEAPFMVTQLLHSVPDYKEKANHDNNSITAIHSHIQSACNTSCGWGGISGQAFTDFWITVIEFELIGVAIVYVGRISYICSIDEEYHSAINAHQLPLWDNCQKSKLNILWKAIK